MRSNKARVKVPIPDSVFVRWKQLYQHGDFTDIYNSFGKTAGFKIFHVQNAFNQRAGRKEVVDAMQKFYEVREKFLKIQESKMMAIA